MRYLRRRLRWAALAAVLMLCATPLRAQTLTVHTPDSLVVGQNKIVRPMAKDVIGRTTSVARVFAISLAPDVLEISYANGGQRFIALKPGLAEVRWYWDRTSPPRIPLPPDTVRVVATAPPADTTPPIIVTPPDTLPPVVAPPDTTPPVVPAVALQRVNISEAGAQLVRGGTSSLSAWAIVSADGRARSATQAELKQAGLSWSSANPAVATVSAPAASPAQAAVRGVAAGQTTVTVCSEAGALCSLPVPVRVQPAPADTATPPPSDTVVTPPADTTPPVVVPPVDTLPTPPVDTLPAPPAPADVGLLVGVGPGEPCRPLVATTFGEVVRDTAYFARALRWIPAALYCVGPDLVVVLEGDVVDESAPPPQPGDTITTIVIPSGAVLPTVWPDTTIAVGDTATLSLAASVPDSEPVHWALFTAGEPTHTDAVIAHSPELPRSEVEAVTPYAVASYVGEDLPPTSPEPHAVRVVGSRPGTTTLSVLVGTERRAPGAWRQVTLTVVP